MSSSSLHGQVALVTGGSRSIGRATALALAARGADVVITYRTNADAAMATVRDLIALGVRAEAIVADLTGTAQLDHLVGEFRRVLAAWGRDTFDILVNNAGILRLVPFDRATEDDLDANFLTNYKSVFFLVQRLAPHLRDGGRIVNLGSGTARIAFQPLVTYGPLKAAVQSLTVYLAAFFGPRRITVNAVAPGGLDGDFNAPLFAVMPQAKDFIAQHTALGRIGVPGDVASVIAFLCSPEAGFISGAVLNVDGGYHL
ncbi:MAG: SDR family oxidoreductase [Gemmatimonadaceae bacterium]|nr:SDR family oxidoreductase [Gemmatimonadaceae bacterium]